MVYSRPPLCTLFGGGGGRERERERERGQNKGDSVFMCIKHSAVGNLCLVKFSGLNCSLWLVQTINFLFFCYAHLKSCFGVGGSADKEEEGKMEVRDG